jgi:hypothetical protein
VKTVDVADDPRAAWLDIEQHGWGDGLPCIPPTPELVDELLGGADPDEPIAVVGPSRATATRGLIAVNAVMAGCPREALPVVLAAIRAVAEPSFNLLAVQSTTNPASEAMVVNGPIRAAAGFASGPSCLGNGQTTNLTVGRAVRMCLVNIGGAKPGSGDRATHGFPGKLAFCFAENEEESPWPPLAQVLGAPAGASAVTVVSASGSLNLLDTADDAEELLWAFARSIAAPCANDSLWGGTPLLVLGPEHAALLDGGGFDRQEVQRFVWERSTVPAGQITTQNRSSFLVPSRSSLYGTIDDTTEIHVSNRPEDLLVAVAGGPGTHSIYLPTFGDSRASMVELDG